MEGSRIFHDLLPGGAAADVAAAGGCCGDRRCVAVVLLPPRDFSAPHADDLFRAGQRRHQRLPPGRSRRGDDARRARQRHRAPALLHLRDRLPVLGPGVCGDADDRAPRGSRVGRARPVRISRAQGALPMSTAVHRTRGFGRGLETTGAWLLGALWILPLAYAFWTAFHPGEFSTRFVLAAPLTLENFVRAWHAAPFARYFINTIILCAMILA